MLVIDDVLATGGTISGILQLLDQVDADIAGLGFLMELGFLKGRDKLQGHRTEALLVY